MEESEVTEYSIRNFYERWDWKRECFIMKCVYCGNIVISSDIMRCPSCDSGNVVIMPFRDCKQFNLSFLKRHGFPFIERVL